MLSLPEMRRHLDRIRDLPTLPAVAVKLNRLLEDPDVTVEAVSGLIEKDQALSLSLLRLVNSSFFGLQAQVASVRRAVVLLGFNQVRNAVVAVSILVAIGREGAEAERLWRHGAAVAATCQCLAGKIAPQKKEDAFTAGLLHDIGKLILWRYFPRRQHELWVQAAAEGVPQHRLEERCGGAGHAAVGAYLARTWRLPRRLEDAIGHHHQPSAATYDPDLAGLVHLADLAVRGLKPEPDAPPPGGPDPAWGADLRARLDAAGDWMADVAQSIAAAEHFFSKDAP